VGVTVNPWNSGLTESITLTSTSGATVSGWKLVFTLPGGQQITGGWSATYAPASGTVTATNVNYNGVLAPGASTTIGFQATHTGNSAAPSSFVLNGTPCSS
jgi:cellulase/cellobiase CelA1